MLLLLHLYPYHSNILIKKFKITLATIYLPLLLLLLLFEVLKPIKAGLQSGKYLNSILNGLMPSSKTLKNDQIFKKSILLD